MTPIFKMLPYLYEPSGKGSCYSAPPHGQHIGIRAPVDGSSEFFREAE